jgi:hypothetical protein
MKHIVTLDADFAYATPGIMAGMQLAFNDGVPTMDDGVAFYISQLAGLESKIYEAKYANINFAELVPIKGDIPEWADTWEYLSYDAVTLGKFIGSSADDLPKVQFSANKSIVPIGYAGVSYDYSLDELRKSQQMRMPIDSTKAKVAFRGSQEHSQRVAYFGDAARNMTGLFNNANVALDNSVINWATATGQEIIDDMNGLGIKVWTDSANVHVPNVWVIDSTRFAQISSQRMDAGTDTTVLEFFLKNNVYTSLTGATPRVVPRLQLTAAELAANGVSNGSKDRMMAYEMNEENLSMANPIPFRPLPPQPQGLNVYVPCEYKLSGVEFRFVFSAAYRDHV